VLSEADCGAFQGDVGVWRKLVFRSVDTPVAAAIPRQTCDAALAESGFEGIQIFRVDDPAHAAPMTSSRPSGPTAAPTPTLS
jgi:hypothetical protein